MSISTRDQAVFDRIEDQLQSLEIPAETRGAIMSGIRVEAAASRVRHEAAARAADSATDVAADVALARTLYASRSRGNRIFGAHILSDPKFEMLLDLFVSEYDGRHVSVSDLCLAADVPQTTGLRYIEKLETAGFVRRSPDPGDGRRWWIEATDRALSGVTHLMQDLRRQANPAGHRALRRTDSEER